MADTVDSKRVREYNEELEPDFSAKLDTLADMVRASKYTGRCSAVAFSSSLIRVSLPPPTPYRPVFYTGAGVSTSTGVGDYRGPSGAWTQRKINQLQAAVTGGSASGDDRDELRRLLQEKAREEKKAQKKIPVFFSLFLHLARFSVLQFHSV